MSSIKDRAFNGVAWTTLYYTLSRAASFISSLVLAAILSPREFGVIGAAYLAIEACQRFANGGVDAYLIYHKKGERRVENTAFQMAVFVGLCSYGLLFFLAPTVGRFFNDNSVMNVIRVMGLSLIIYSLKAVPSAILEKNLAFRARLTPDIIGILSKVTFTIIFALAGLGAWSIVAGLLISETIVTLLLFVKTKWVPRELLHVDSESLKEIFSYTKNIQFAGILAFITMNMDYSVVGRFLGTVYLGFYTFAFNIANLPAVLITQPVSRVMFPTYSELRHKEEIGQAFLKVSKYISTAALPMGVGMYFTVPLLLTYAYGNKWALAIPVLKILLVLGVVRAIFSGTGEVFKALGRPELISALTLGLVVIALPALVIWGRHSMIYVGTIMVLMSLFFAVVSLYVVVKLTGITPVMFIGAMKYPLLNAAILAGWLAIVSSGNFLQLSALANLSISILSGGLLYGALTILLDPKAVEEIKSMLRERLPSSKKKVITYVKA